MGKAEPKTNRPLTRFLADSASFQELVRKLLEGGHHLLYGLGGSQRALLLDYLVARGQPVLYVAAGVKEAETVLADYEFFSGRKGQLFPARPVLAGEIEAESQELDVQRLRAVTQMVSGGCLVAAPVTALLEPLPPRKELVSNRLFLRRGMETDISQLTAKLTALGYQKVDQVDAPGQFSQRGDILDIYDAAHLFPHRIQLYDVEVESIRQFDLASQRSKAEQQQLVCGPARMVPLAGPVRQRVVDKLNKLEAGVAENFRSQLQKDREKFAALGYWAGCQRYIQYMYDRVESLVEYFQDGLVVTAETPDLLKKLDIQAGELLDRQQNLLESGKLLPDLQPFFPVPELVFRWQKIATVHTGLLMRSPRGYKLNSLGSIPFRQVPSFYGQRKLLVEECAAWLKRGATIVVVGGNKQLQTSLADEDIPARMTEPEQLKANVVNIVPGHISSGFELLDQGLVVLSMAEIAGRKRRVHRPREQQGLAASDIHSLQPGEYVVHASHGIGQFIGVVAREVAGVKRDYLYIRYAGKDKLFLPTDQVHYLQRYLGSGDKPPRLYSLGGGDWQRVKKQVRESVQKMAFDLLQLYAKRQAARGHSFAPDTPWQRELEDSFPYQETPDQFRSIQQVKEDMESPRPMDRLLCGDVGYGKTEVALRAAMKAVMDDRQVVLLAPTTVLAQQHYRTFSERFAPFPVKVEVLSRFRSAARQKEIVREIKNGSVDIIIGTHRLLQQDVECPRLGLVIIDEEQRFGVEHKEKLKQLRANVDVLTMTATPIPRTLQMALLGIRDLSVINTPPEGRYPVQTYVMEYSDQTIVFAVRRELDRGGQVYVIFNRVQGIEATASRLRLLLPDVDIAVIHGQMAEGQIEKTMLNFYEGRHQVLLSTTIIENGLDIPNVNTVIVFDADRLGLSQLYQLRGRVGRGRRLAYAYFTYRPDRVLTEKAQKRLAAIKEFTQLGAGYKLSLKDLEIRGAGNILGPEQHGFIAAVGFDLYCQLLEEQVRNLTGQPAAIDERPEVVLDLPVDAYVPEEYLPEQEKFYVYRRIRDAASQAVVDDLEEELRDRFGPLPLPLSNLLDVGRIKVLAAAAGVKSVEHVVDSITGAARLRLTFMAEREPEPATLQKLWSAFRTRFDFSRGRETVAIWVVGDSLLAELEQLLHYLTASSH